MSANGRGISGRYVMAWREDARHTEARIVLGPWPVVRDWPRGAMVWKVPVRWSNRAALDWALNRAEKLPCHDS